MDARRRAQIVIAIAHPLRRRILQTIVDRKESLSPAEIASEFALPVGTITYHAKVLWHFGALEPAGERDVRGAIEQVYGTTADDHAPLGKLLEEAQQSDDESTEVSDP
jgi:DNA-binding transcriptional ArsR family regulator